MAELVDAPSSGGGGGNPVEVRVLFWAPFVLLTFSQIIYKNVKRQNLGHLCPNVSGVSDKVRVMFLI